VRASMGHVRDLPSKGMGVDLKTFVPEYEILKDRGKVITELKKLAKDADEIYLATDLDREGEAIAWHLKEALGIPDERVKRAIFAADIDAAGCRELSAQWIDFLTNTGNGERTKIEREKWLSQNGAFTAELIELAGKKFEPSDKDAARKAAELLGFVVDELKTT